MAKIDSEITVTYTLTEDDFARLCWTVRRKRIFTTISIVLGIMCLPGVLMALSQSISPEPRQLLSFALFLLMLPLVCFVLVPQLIRRAYRRAYWNNPNAQRETTYRITSRSISSCSAVAHSEVAWEAIVEILETKEDFIFFASKFSAYLLPKEVLPSLDERQRLRRIVMEAAGDRAKLRPNEDEV